MRRKITCPNCKEFGKLELQNGDKYRVNHDHMVNGQRVRDRCYLGSLGKAISNLESVSDVRDDILDPVLLSEIKSAIKEKKAEHNEKIKESEYGTLISSIIKLSNDFGLWKSDRHNLTKQATCPHCSKNIQYEFVRVGPFQSPKKNIESFFIGKGSDSKTSRMREF